MDVDYRTRFTPGGELREHLRELDRATHRARKSFHDYCGYFASLESIFGNKSDRILSQIRLYKKAKMEFELQTKDVNPLQIHELLRDLD